ncbi:polysaccharide deacetylase family protein [Mesorhizobium sp.]|uniref:polysaccharide deacetylase family protein n=1 Tax=Mesorhizobium sp. TaxID=1871066 RepID=UPI0025C2F7E0|nr:polysaccharide deacetylase family protein [Mesorhizobium sp.]
MAGGAQPKKGEAESAAGQLGLTLSPTSLTQPGVMAAHRDRNRFLRMPLRFVLPFLLFAASPALAADRTIYLTFDDGPLNGTANILDVLQAEQVPGTLFMVGMHAEANATSRALLQRAKSMPLVTIGNHSYSHAYNHYRHFYGDTEGVVADMLSANVVLGLKPAVHARLPGRDVFRLPNYSKDDNSLGLAEAGREDPELRIRRGFRLLALRLGSRVDA